SLRKKYASSPRVRREMTIVRIRGRMPVNRLPANGAMARDDRYRSPELRQPHDGSSRLVTQSCKHVNCDTSRQRSVLQSGFRGLLESRECSTGKLAERACRAAHPRELYYRISL